MAKTFKSILFKIDFIGIIPQLKIFDNNIYKSMFSSIFSIIVIIFSVAFAIYSFLEFINQNPMIDYYKTNDFITNKTIEISDSFIMFQIEALDNNNEAITNLSFESDYSNDIDLQILLIVEPCQFGKNIDLKYQKLFEDYEKREKETISNYFCINFNNNNISFFHHPNDNNRNQSLLRLIIYSNESEYDIQSLTLKIVTENDIIDHNNKENPIIPYYFYNIIDFYNISEIASIKYDFQYIKYESDTGIFFENSNSINAIGFSGLSYSNNYNFQNSGLLTIINFGVNKSNYDYYKRTYKKFQSFLADVTSLINLIITILKLLTYFLLKKKMNKDIIRKIMNFDRFKEEKEKISHSKKSGLFKKLKDIDKNKTISEFMEKQNSKEFLKESINIKLKDKKLKERNIKVLKNLKFFDIIKSFFCFQDAKTKLIDLCNRIINEDICIDRILIRLYNLEKIYSLIENKENDKHKFNRKEDAKKLDDYIFQINYETEGSINHKKEKWKKENYQIK